MDKLRVKYLISAAVILFFAQLVFGSSAPRSMFAAAAADSARTQDSVPAYTLPEATAEVPEATALTRSERRAQARAAREKARRHAEFEAMSQQERDSMFSSQVDSLIAQRADSLANRQADTVARDSVKRPRKPGAFLDDPISGKNKDSLVYDVRNKMVYIYNEGDVTYQKSNLKADYMQIDMNSKLIHAYGKPDSLEGKAIVTKPEFSDGGEAPYKMDTITYNLESKKAKIKG
ncbi:MAG: LPS-assembly protein LptD, partial [Alistipes sp.]|nr:LPS-assembly protein LptD [Alistipes sp.]